MRKLLLTLFLTLTQIYIYAQQQVKGTINDTEGKPIAFVTVAVKGTVTGTLTNDLGQFTLQVPTLPAQLAISHLSYISQEVTATDNQPLIISLKQQVVQLQEVVVGNPGLALIKEASAKAGKAVMKNFTGKAFSRQVMTEGEQPVFFAENFLDVQWQNWGITKYNNTNSRYLARPNAVSYTNITLFSYLATGYVGNSQLISPISHNPDSLYKYKIRETFKNGDQEIAVVSCLLKDPDNISHAAFEVDIYINTNTYDILKTEGTLAKFKLNKTGLYSIKLKDLKVTSQYKLNSDGINVLDYSSFTITSDVKVMGIGVKKLVYSSKIFILNYDAAIPSSALTDIDLASKEKDEDRVTKTAYDAAFWQNNPVIRRTQAEDDAISLLEGQKSKKGNMEVGQAH
jgi:hypothetical protein